MRISTCGLGSRRQTGNRVARPSSALVLKELQWVRTPPLSFMQRNFRHVKVKGIYRFLLSARNVTSSTEGAFPTCVFRSEYTALQISLGVNIL